MTCQQQVTPLLLSKLVHFEVRVVSFFTSAGFTDCEGYGEDCPDAGCLKLTVVSLQEQSSRHASEFRGRLTYGRNRRGYEGEKGDIVEANECNILAHFNIQLLKCFDHPDG